MGHKFKSKTNKGLENKHKINKITPNYHRVPFDYVTKTKSRNDNKVIREVIPRFDLTKTILTKVSKKPRKFIREIYREVILSQYLVNPRNSNR